MLVRDRRATSQAAAPQPSIGGGVTVDQVNTLYLNLPRHNQLGRSPCCYGMTCGSTACTDNCVSEIIRHQTKRQVTPAQVRAATGRPVCRGLRPSDVLHALVAFGVRGYTYRSGVTVDDVLRATDRGVVLTGVGYAAFPREAGVSGPGGVAEIGGKTDVTFRGAHAITVWGRRSWTKRPANWTGPAFHPGTRVWTRDPDHRQGYDTPYDRISIGQLADAMRALVTQTPWATTFAIWKV